MQTLIVVNNPSRWELDVPNVQIIAAKSYLTDAHYSGMPKARVFNLCRSYKYQSIGYYVSLLATARGHKPLPDIESIQDMRSYAIIRLVSDELNELIQKSLKPIQSETFILSVYFGKNLAKRYDQLSSQLFKNFQAPFLRAEFRKSDSQWVLHRIRPMPSKEIPMDHRPFVNQSAHDFFSSSGFRSPKRTGAIYDIAILHDPKEEEPPSNDKALQKFIRAAKRMKMGAELITKDDYGLLPQYDALFIRETTRVNHHSYRFSRRAAAEGLVVIDDPASIEQCTNKVFLAELLERNRVPAPQTMIVHQDNKDSIVETIGLPCIIKKPDSCFSQGVYKVETEEALHQRLDAMLAESDLIVAQEFMPTEFDWRIGILDRKPLYACKYFMAKKHWQIMKSQGEKETDYGKVETLYVHEAPPQVVRVALRAANLIGDGLYGVDLKQAGSKVVVIEINDNPSLDAGYEDRALKDELYNQVMSVFLKRIGQRKERIPS